MAGGQEIRISKALWEGFVGVVRDTSSDEARQIIVLAAYLDLLSERCGLSDRHEDELVSRANEPARFLPAMSHYLAGGESVEPEIIRNRLYKALDGMDAATCGLVPGVGKTIRDDRLEIAQVYWNLSWDAVDRPNLPLKPGGQVDGFDKSGQPTTYRAVIWVPWVDHEDKDLANHLRTNRTDLVKGGRIRTSGRTLRAEGALLAVLAAAHIVRQGEPADSRLLEGAQYRGIDDTERPTSFGWPSPEHAVPNRLRPESTPPSDGSLVKVGRPVDPGEGYQRRDFEAEIESHWADGGDRRVWLLGGTGLGKSCTAGRVAQEVIANRGENRERLLVWVDSADAQATTTAYADAFDQLREQGFPVRGRSEDSDETKASSLLDALATSPWPWLVVLDDADPGSLIQARLVPSGRNPNGRVLITTMRDHNPMRSNGRVVSAELFTPAEAEAYLRNEIHLRERENGPLASASQAETAALASEVAHHPLALSIAVGTIRAKAMTIHEWISEFRQAPVMDSAADEPDGVGYPRLIGAAWQVALTQASQGMPDDVVERAALVAAIQSPDGHPTWLWDGAVAGWVTGNPPTERRAGMPAGVRRLVEYRILDLRGGIWTGGRLAIHQLAARAIRERAQPQHIEELAEILATQWLLHVADYEFAARTELRRNVEQLLSLDTPLTDGARRTASALAEFSKGPDPNEVADQQRRLAVLEPHWEAGGITGRVHRAKDLATLAAKQASLGMQVDAHANYRRSAEDYESLSVEPSATDAERADWLRALGQVYDGLGQPSTAQRSRERAVDLYRKLLEAELDVRTRLEHVLALAKLLDRLGRSEDKHDVLERNREPLRVGAATLPAISEVETDKSVLKGRGLFTARYAAYLKQIGEFEAAAEQRLAAAGLYRRANPDWGDEMELEAARLYIALKRWPDAEPPLRRVVANDPTNVRARVLHACVLMHLGHIEGAGADLQAAARRREEREAADSMDGAEAEQPDTRHADVDFASVRLRAYEKEATDRGRWGDAVGLSGQILAIAQARSDADPGGHESQLAAEYDNHASNLLMNGDRPEALEALLKAIRIRETLSAMTPGEPEHRVRLALSLTAFGNVSVQQSDDDGAAADALGRAVTALESITDDDDPHTEIPRFLGWALSGLGALHLKTNRETEAERILTRAAQTLEHSLDRNPDDGFTRITFATVLSQLGFIQLEAGLEPVAEESLRLAALHFEHLLSQDPTDGALQALQVLAACSLASALLMLGVAYWEEGQTEDAEGAFARIISLGDRFAAVDHRLSSMGSLSPEVLTALEGLRFFSGMALAFVAGLHQESDRLEEAEVALVRAVAALGEDVGRSAQDLSGRLLLEVLESLAELYQKLGRDMEADATLSRAEFVRQQIGGQTSEEPE